MRLHPPQMPPVREVGLDFGSQMPAFEVNPSWVDRMLLDARGLSHGFTFIACCCS